MALISELITQVKADTSQFRREIDGATKSGATFASSFKSYQVGVVAAIGIISTAMVGLGSVIANQAHAIDDLGDTANKLGVSFQGFQSLSYAARLADVDISTLQTSFSRMSAIINKASQGNEAAAASLSRIGLSVQDLINLAPDQQFQKIAEAINSIGNATEQRGSVLEIFGRGGLENINLLTSNIKGAREEFDRFGLALSDVQLKNSTAFDEMSKKFSAFSSGLTSQVASNVIPAFTIFLETLMGVDDGFNTIRDTAKSIANVILSVAEAFFTFQSIALVPIDALINGLTVIWNLLKDVLNLFRGDFKELKNPFDFKPSQLSVKSYGVGSKIGEYRNQMNSGINDFSSNSAGSVGSMKIITDSQEKFTDSINESTAVVKKSTDGLNEFQKQAIKTADFLDRFTQIQNAFEGPGKKQATDIINGAVANNASPLADSSEFSELFSKVLADSKTGNTNNLDSQISKLQDIIDKQSGARYNYNGSIQKDFPKTDVDTSGLVSSLNELKAYLVKKDVNKQQVDVSIKVDPSKDFITTITTNQTFKEAVDAEVSSQVAEAARGDLS
jgi:hypothetical protein